ncbi:DUF2244 domain-containing protein [Rhodobacteraceae bacterium CCMM004]|nr:DUF2244 domain-containing protein [Rhodobacteraceae bacterium CCMM004]
MPVEWLTRPDKAPASPGAFSSGGVVARACLWPHRSLPRRGFAAFILITFFLILMPTVPLLGTPVLWGLLPFLLGAVALLWYFLDRSYRDGELTEELVLWSDRVRLTRRNPRGPAQEWEANPHWVRVEMHESGGPVENYVTLRGGGRAVEIGAFLSPEERETLYGDLRHLFARVA